MLHVLVGTVGERSAKRRALKLSFDEISAQSATPEEIAALAGTPTLMGDSRAFLLEGALAGEYGAGLLDIAKELAASVHTFVFEEDKLLAKPIEKLTKAGAKVAVLKDAAKKEPFNVFSLANALAARDRKKLWLLLMDAFRQGVAPENIAGVLHWKARTACAAARGKERASLEKLSRDLVVMYHESHRGAGDLALLLERFALTLD